MPSSVAAAGGVAAGVVAAVGGVERGRGRRRSRAGRRRWGGGTRGSSPGRSERRRNHSARQRGRARAGRRGGRGDRRVGGRRRRAGGRGTRRRRRPRPPSSSRRSTGRPARGPVGVGVPDRAAAFAEPAPAVLGIAEPAARRERRRVAHRDQPVVRSARSRRAAIAARTPRSALRRPRVARRAGPPRSRAWAPPRQKVGSSSGAAGPVEGAVGDQLAEADVVGADGHAPPSARRRAARPPRAGRPAAPRRSAACRPRPAGQRFAAFAPEQARFDPRSTAIGALSIGATSERWQSFASDGAVDPARVVGAAPSHRSRRRRGRSPSGSRTVRSRCPSSGRPRRR